MGDGFTVNSNINCKGGTKHMKKFMGLVCTMLISLAPASLMHTACFFFWGEPECPEELRDSVL